MRPPEGGKEGGKKSPNKKTALNIQESHIYADIYSLCTSIFKINVASHVIVC